MSSTARSLLTMATEFASLPLSWRDHFRKRIVASLS